MVGQLEGILAKGYETRRNVEDRRRELTDAEQRMTDLKNEILKLKTQILDLEFSASGIVNSHCFA